MYEIKVPHKDLFERPYNPTIYFNLFENEVMKLLPELKAVFDWLEKTPKGEPRDLDPFDVRDFYTNFESILLDAYGVPAEDGRSFKKAGRYEYEESTTHNALMVMCLTDPDQIGKLLEGTMPKGMDELVKKLDANLVKELANSTDEERKAEIERLRRQLAEAEGNAELSAS